MKIRVLHVIDHLGYGGAPVAVKNMAERISGDEIEIIVCALRTNPDAMEIKTKSINLTYGRYNPLAFWAVIKLCKDHKIDIIHAHLQKSVINCLLVGYFCKAKIIIHEHGPIFRGGTGSLYRLLLRMLGSRASMAIANSQATQAALQKTTGLDEEFVSVVSNFIDFSRFDRTLYDRDRAREKLGITSGQKVVGFVGRLDPCKGVDLLINAAAILCGKDERYRFIIVGQGRQRQQFEQLVLRLGLKEKVAFTGLCRNPAELMIAFDVAVVPSRREAFGIAAVELMRMKVPVIASAIGGLVEVVQHDNTGILLDKLDEQSIAEAVERLVRQDVLRESLTVNAEEFSRRFDGEEQVRQIADLYRRLCP